MSITNHVNASNQKTFNLTTYDKINYSSTQSKFSFSKAQRFPTIKANNPVSCYDIPTTKSTRAAGMGYGASEPFVGRSNSPSPDKYKMASQFDTFKDAPNQSGAFGKPKKTFCFGAGREDFTKTVFNTTNMYPDPIVPGPGNYTDGTKLIGVNARKTSLKERKFYLDTEEMAKKLSIPGPGTYNDQQQLHATGSYVNSQMMNSKAARINTGRRFGSFDNHQPGPGEYDELGNVASGKQVCSNFHSTITKNMGTTDKRTQWGGHPRFRTPGPGTYRPPTDFGYLDFKNQLHDNINDSQMTRMQKSVMTGASDANRSLNIGKIESQAVSIQSDRKRGRNNSIFKTHEVAEPMTGRVAAKKQSIGGGVGNQSSRRAALTQESTQFSMNQSVESPRRQGAYQTSMTNQHAYRSQDESSELRVSPGGGARNKTPQGQAYAPSQQTQQKFLRKQKKGTTMRDMVVIYGDLAQKPPMRQEAAATQIRQQYQALKQQRPQGVEVDGKDRIVSELGNKPNSMAGVDSIEQRE